MSRVFHFCIHQKTLRSTQFFYEFLSIFPFLLHNLVQVLFDIAWFPLFHPMLFSPLLLERVVTRKLLLTRRTNRWLFGCWWSMLLCYVIVHFLLIVSTKSTLWTRNNSSHTIFAMSSRIRLPVFFVTVLAFHFLIPVEWRHLKKSGRFNMYQNKKKYVVPTKFSDSKCPKNY